MSTLSRKFEIIQRIEVGLNCYICDIAAYIAGARKISSPPLNIIAWDHFLLHRGTPISPSRMQGLSADLKDAKSLINNYHLVQTG